MCVYEQKLIYLFVQLYKNNNTRLTKQNVLELKDKNENKHQGFFIFCIILDHLLPVYIAYVCDILYMCYINKYLKYIYTGKKIDKKK